MIHQLDFGEEKEGPLKGYPNLHVVFDPDQIKDITTFIQEFLKYASTADRLGNLIQQASMAFSKGKK